MLIYFSTLAVILFKFFCLKKRRRHLHQKQQGGRVSVKTCDRTPLPPKEFNDYQIQCVVLTDFQAPNTQTVKKNANFNGQYKMCLFDAHTFCIVH